MSSLLNNAQNVRITGGLFNITSNFNTVNGPSLEVLHKRAAPNAILNAGGRADGVRCHPGTRKEVIGRIEKWDNTQDGLSAPMYWLSGPAGAGKSAIMQTIAERCDERGVPHANFFFFRTDTSRSNASPLVATLLYQIVLLYPLLQDPVATLLAADPLIFDSVLENQLVQLIITPLRTIQQSSSAYRPLLLLIDGLDECDSETKRSQQQILHSFDKVLAEHPCLFHLLVASRDESQIRMAFNKLSSQCIHLYLNDDYSRENDIRAFVNAQFKQVRKDHPLAHTLNATWPSVSDVDYIVEKSSGQFIYAATVMRFILDSSASPMVSLERVQGAVRLATKLPFSHLDAIYAYILSQADDQELLKDILHAHALIDKATDVRLDTPPLDLRAPGPEVQLIKLLEVFNKNYTETLVLSCLADLSPIIQYIPRARTLLFYHASFPDYLFDQLRSKDYFVDVAAFNYKTLPAVWTLMDNKTHCDLWLEFGVVGLCLLKKPPPGLMNKLASLNNVWSSHYFPPWLQSSFFKIIYNLCIYDGDVDNYKRIIGSWMRDCSHSKVTADLRQIEGLPHGRRYFYMAYIDSDWWWQMPQEDAMLAVLSPKTDFGRHESALWLNKLLHDIHISHSDVNKSKQLLKKWISCAVANNIPCDGLEDIPNAQQYIRSSMFKKWVANIVGSRK